jgi:hypothetical protein
MSVRGVLQQIDFRVRGVDEHGGLSKQSIEDFANCLQPAIGVP